MDKLETGDILLFYSRSNNIFYKLLDMGIQYFTDSVYSHTAIVLKDPTFIHPSLKGIYMWESSWEGTPDPQDNKVKLGVQITPIFEFLKTYTGAIYVRKLNLGNEMISVEKLKEIHNVVYDKPYDYNPVDWINAISRKDNDSQKTSKFWCSALVSYILVKIGFLPETLDWSIVRPQDLSSSSNYLTFNNCEYDCDKKIYEKWTLL